MRFKGICTAALLIAAMTLAACGSSNDGDSTEAAGTRGGATGTTGTTGTPRGTSGSGAVDRNARSDRNGSPADSGGSSAPTSPADGSGDRDAPSQDKAQTPARPGKKSKPKTSDPIEAVENLSGAERKKLHADLYEQGEMLCRAYGPAELAKTFNLPTTDAEQLAKLYAEKYEQATPSLVLPVQQGCLAGFKQWSNDQP
jgi:hypothetical protein